MRSVNTARKAGRDLGRAIEDIWLPDDLISTYVTRQITPRIKLLRSSEDRAREAWSGWLGLSVVLLVVSIFICAFRFLPVGLFGELPILTRISEVIGTWSSAVLVLMTLLLVAFVALSGIGSVAARKRAENAHEMAVSELCQAAIEGALTVLAARRSTVGMPIENRPGRSLPRPAAQPRGTDPCGAEEIVAQWMRHLGESDARVTQFTGDGGIDVVGLRYIAQVKHYSGSVGVAAIRELLGVATADAYGRRPLFFAKTGYAPGAVQFANNVGVALFVYDVERGNLTGMNGLAKTLMHNGLG